MKRPRIKPSFPKDFEKADCSKNLESRLIHAIAGKTISLSSAELKNASLTALLSSKLAALQEKNRF